VKKLSDYTPAEREAVARAGTIRAEGLAAKIIELVDEHVKLQTHFAAGGADSMVAVQMATVGILLAWKVPFDVFVNRLRLHFEEAQQKDYSGPAPAPRPLGDRGN
jgi:hypothetical protein